MTSYAQFVKELAPVGEGWRIVISFVGSGGELVRALWPHSAAQPQGVSIRDGLILEAPDVEGEFEIYGLTRAAVLEMDEGFVRAFADAGFSLDEGSTNGSSSQPRPGEYWLVDRSTGQPLGRVEPRKVSIEAKTSAIPLPGGPTVTREALKLAADLYNPVAMAIEYANESGYTIAVGLDGDAAAVLGVTAGAGLYYSADGDAGIYWSIGADAGAIIGVSIGLAAMVLSGPASRMAGDGYALEASVTIVPVSVGGGVLYDSTGEPYGWAGEVGVGIGAAGAAYGSWSYTWLKSF